MPRDPSDGSLLTLLILPLAERYIGAAVLLCFLAPSDDCKDTHFPGSYPVLFGQPLFGVLIGTYQVWTKEHNSVPNSQLCDIVSQANIGLTVGARGTTHL